jgi:putative secretion ATPase (PEP-CTERM system associated)
MYESFFNLTTKPFDLVPNPDFLFLSKAHKRALVYLDYGINERAGFILLTGEIGSGKTTLIRDLIKHTRPGVVLSKIFNTNVNFDQLLAMINDDFNLPVQGKDRIALMRDLNDFLIEQYSLGNRPTLIIDEAQNLTPELLEDIRMLSNLETDDTKLLQIIMVGQPELRRTLSLPGLLQLRQRISINCHINPLTRTEVEEYILHRLEVAGNRRAVTFSAEAMDIICGYSRGIPRLINIICDFLMLAAFAEERTHLDAEMAEDLVGDLDFENRYWEGVASAEAVDGRAAEGTNGEAVGLKQVLEALEGISSRLAGLEMKSSAFGETTLRAMEDKFSSMEKAFRIFTREVDETVSELQDMIHSGHMKREECLPGQKSIESPFVRGPQVLLAALRGKAAASE